jgi:hypothetical protein
VPINRSTTPCSMCAMSPRVAFYCDVLATPVAIRGDSRRGVSRAAGSSNDHDLAVRGWRRRGPVARWSRHGGALYSAWEVDTLGDLESSPDAPHSRCACRRARPRRQSHGRDPNGLEFEIAWAVPAALLTPTPALGPQSGH